jgi:hypothetical protein
LEKDYEEVGAESNDGKGDEEEYWVIAAASIFCISVTWWIVGTKHGFLVAGIWRKMFPLCTSFITIKPSNM